MDMLCCKNEEQMLKMFALRMLRRTLGRSCTEILQQYLTCGNQFFKSLSTMLTVSVRHSRPFIVHPCGGFAV